MSHVRNVIAGALSGLGVVILLQQYSVAYPTGMVAIIGIVVGIAVQFGIAALFKPRPAAAPMVAYEPEPQAEPAAPQWTPTHTVGEAGLDAWTQPDAAAAPEARLEPGLGVQVVAEHGDWAQVLCENRWSAWVDGRLLVPASTEVQS